MDLCIIIFTIALVLITTLSAALLYFIRKSNSMEEKIRQINTINRNLRKELHQQQTAKEQLDIFIDHKDIETKEEMEKLQTSLDYFKAKFNTAIVSLKDYEHKLSTTKCELLTASMEIKELEKELLFKELENTTKLRQLHKQYEYDLTQVEEENHNLTKQIDTLEAKHNRITTHHQNTLNTWRTEMDQINSTQETQSSYIATLTTKCKSSNRNLIATTNKLMDRESEIEELDDHAYNLRQKLSVKDEQVKNLKRQLDSAKLDEFYQELNF